MDKRGKFTFFSLIAHAPLFFILILTYSGLGYNFPYMWALGGWTRCIPESMRQHSYAPTRRTTDYGNPMYADSYHFWFEWVVPWPCFQIQRVCILGYSPQMSRDFFYATERKLVLSSSFIFLRWHKTRELEFAHLMLSVYKVIAGFLVLNCCWKTQPLLNYYPHIFRSPTMHYNAFVLCQCYQRQLVFIRYPLDAWHCARGCQGHLRRMKHYQGEGWRCSSLCSLPLFLSLWIGSSGWSNYTMCLKDSLRIS